MKNTKLEIIKYKDNLLLKTTQGNDAIFKKFNTHDISELHRLHSDNIISPSVSKSKQYKKKIFLKGLGYKVTQEKDTLIFKLNYSHTIVLNVPAYINKVTVNKKNIVFESSDAVLLGSFLEKVYVLKPKDSYKGKGFSLKTKVVPLKEIKKK